MEKLLKYILVGLTLALVASILVLGSTPPVDRDALTHHLAVPKLYLKHGSLYEIPHIEFSYYPMNLDLLYMIPLLFGNDIIPKYIHFAFGLLTALLIFTYLKNRLSSILGAFGALFFLSLPVIVKLSTTVYVDLGLICFSTAALIFMLAWIDHPLKIRYLLFSAISCGLCLGTKYNGLITFFLLTCFVPLSYIRTRRQISPSGFLQDEAIASCRSYAKNEGVRAIGYGIIFAVVALVVFSPWMVRNYIWTKNPIYPLYSSIFASKQTASSSAMDGSAFAEAREESAGENQAINHFLIRRHVFKEPLWQTLLIPVRIFFEGRDDNPQFFDGQLNPFLLFLPMAAFIRTRPTQSRAGRNRWIFLSFAGLYLFFAFFKADMRIRYIAPIIPPLVILSAYGLHNIAGMVKCIQPARARNLLAMAGVTCISLLFFLNASYVMEQFRLLRPHDYVLGKIDRDSYIQVCRPEYRVIQYSNRYLSEDSKILGAYLGNRLYYWDRELFFGDQLLLKTLQRSMSPEEVLETIKGKGFTHIVINLYKFVSWYGQKLTSVEQDRLLQFFRDQLTLLSSHDGYQLFKI